MTGSALAPAEGQSTFPMRVYTWCLPPQQAQALGEWVDNLSAFENEDGSWTLQVCRSISEGPLAPEILAVFAPQEVTQLTYQDWLRSAQQDLAPVRVGPFYIRTPQQPPYSQVGADPEARDLCIGASLAFGSGHHETTQGCLRLIDRLARQAPWTRALDWGCGSGILALAMNLLIAGSAEGIDSDPQAVEVAQAHSALNAVPTKFWVADTLAPQPSYDCIVANLLAPLLISFAPSIASGRQAVVSGMLLDQVEGVLTAYQGQGMHLVERVDLGQWSTLWLSKSR